MEIPLKLSLVAVLSVILIKLCDAKDCYQCAGDACGGDYGANTNKISKKCSDTGSKCFRFYSGDFTQRGCSSGADGITQAKFDCTSAALSNGGEDDFTLGDKKDGKIYCCDSNNCNTGATERPGVTMATLAVGTAIGMWKYML